jgi:hypothetical protein
MESENPTLLRRHIRCVSFCCGRLCTEPNSAREVDATDELQLTELNRVEEAGLPQLCTGPHSNPAPRLQAKANGSTEKASSPWLYCHTLSGHITTSYAPRLSTYTTPSAGKDGSTTTHRAPCPVATTHVSHHGDCLGNHGASPSVA